MIFTDKIRKPVVDGMFYPADPVELADMVNNFLSEAKFNEIPVKKLFGIIAPHAGYPYSGPITGFSYNLIRKRPSRNFVIIAPSHREYFQGFSLYPGQAYNTPLGDIPIDQNNGQFLLDNCPSLILSDAGHREEHALEVQLPFLQTLFGNEISIIPIVMGDVSLSDIKSMAKTLHLLNRENEFLVIASSDLSHYHSYDMANVKDNHLISILEKFDLDTLAEGFQSHELEACGLGPILTLMTFAKESGDAKFKLLDHRNSGDTSGMHSQVVGYMAGAVYL